MGVLNCPQAIIRVWIQEATDKNFGIVMTNEQNVMMWSFVISLFLVGCTFGGLKGGYLADKVGRRQAFLLNYILCLISCGSFAFCKIFHVIQIILASQFLFGISAGISSCLVPIYLSEIELDFFKGMPVIHALGISLGMFISQICGLESLLGTAELWPYLMYVPMSCALIALILHPYLQESPVYLAFIHENEVHRKHILISQNYNQNLEKETLLSNEFISSVQSEPNKYTLCKLCKERSLHKVILLTILLYMNTVFSGVNAILTYGNVILTSAGLNQQQSEIASVCATGLRCSMSVVAIILTKKCRRRPVILTALGGCFISLIMLMICLCYHNDSYIATYMAISSCVLYFIFYASGLGALACTVSAELLPDNPKALVMSYATGIYWMSNILIGTTFPLLQNSLGAFSLVFFIFYCIIAATIFYFYLPETFNNGSIIENSNDTHDKQIEKSDYLLIS